ncbi:hypothetical protein COCCADRAFT_85619 [Bipolaris zeicola 26-R-13]|uniref:Amine oxidase domain-containing protein n=1 Tax=Cochliobolus carbonum (strain 26-R-13) TaxID=930089 RepID=W6YPM4_COCC2|nr:uncharacterized protein COCCADRAFT_85619 [Bipolaris zeicola 26-R-13]EUC37469.1 hypothetical protein COCCADRAFT_85619 [Bipolaris zeicola 26-R-13]
MSKPMSILSFLLFSIPTGLAINEKSRPIEITKDVVIIGGGASGTYAAVRLREDLGKSVIVIEPRPNLGGHTSTYLIPETNTTVDYGVQSYLPYGPASSFFARFNITTEVFSPERLNSLNVDVETGKTLLDYRAPSLNATNEALSRWLTITQKYQQYLEPGYWSFPRPGDIPDDFLIPFEQFAKREGIEAAVPRITAISGVGYGGVRDLLTLTVFQAFGASLTQDFLQSKLFRPTNSNNALLYTRALSLLKSDILLSSTVQSTKRTKNSIQLTVTHANGTSYLITTKKILFTAPPTLTNLLPFNPDKRQKTLFTPWTPSAEFVAIIHAPCLPAKTSISFLPHAVVPTSYLSLKDYPYTLRLDATGPVGTNLFRVVFGANYTLSTPEFQQLVRDRVQDVIRAGSVNTTATANCEITFRASSDHSRPWWPQDAAKIQSGFVSKVNSLQGYKGMWFAGYAWGAPYSSTVWAVVDTVLERMVGV